MLFYVDEGRRGRGELLGLGLGTGEEFLEDGEGEGWQGLLGGFG
jgi:hypothetical protein